MVSTDKRRGYTAVFTLLHALAVFVAAGCGGGGSSSAPSVRLAAADYVYVANGRGGSISAYKVDPVTFALTLVVERPGPTLPSSLVAHPSGRFIYVADPTYGFGGRLMYFAVDAATGDINYIRQVGASPWRLWLDPGGQVAFGDNGRSGSLVSLSVNPLTADASIGNVVPGETDKNASVAVDPLSRFIFVSWLVTGPFGTNPHLDTYRINTTSGALTFVSTLAGNPDVPFKVVVHPNGRFAYGIADDLRTYGVVDATGAVTQIRTQAIAPSNGLALHPNGRFLFRTEVDGLLAVSALDPATGMLAPAGSIPLPAKPLTNAIVIGADGKAAFIVLEGNQVVAVALDPATGTPRVVGTVATGEDPMSITTLRTDP